MLTGEMSCSRGSDVGADTVDFHYHRSWLLVQREFPSTVSSQDRREPTHPLLAGPSLLSKSNYTKRNNLFRYASIAVA